MNNENNGGQAFPVVEIDGVWSTGMTLRDYFAGQALAGICANASKEWYGATPYDIAEASVIIADEMLKAREQ